MKTYICKNRRCSTRLVSVASLAVVLAWPLWASEVVQPMASAAAPRACVDLPVASMPEENGPRIQLALLLDTSRSMDGLIEQAKSQLWKVVNTFIDARQNGKMPVVEVALYEYGKDSLNAESHWVRCLQPLTRDLDKVSEELFALKTNGGSEFCGAVISKAVADLAWDASSDTYKALFIAGNEPFTQGPITPEVACKAAATRGVVVNTIHCGTEQVGLDTGWKKGADLADGRYLVIDSNKAVVHIEAPQDAEIVKLNASLNTTYIGFGAGGSEGMARQQQQDVNAASMAPAGAAMQRAITKSSANYNNATWDLVDAAKDKKFDIAKLEKEELPKELQGLDTEQIKQRIDAKAAERAAIQNKIAELAKQREAYLIEQKKSATSRENADTLDAAISQTVRAQAEKKGIRFE